MLCNLIDSFHRISCSYINQARNSCSTSPLFPMTHFYLPSRPTEVLAMIAKPAILGYLDDFIHSAEDVGCQLNRWYFSNHIRSTEYCRSSKWIQHHRSSPPILKATPKHYYRSDGKGAWRPRYMQQEQGAVCSNPPTTATAVDTDKVAPSQTSGQAMDAHSMCLRAGRVPRKLG